LVEGLYLPYNILSRVAVGLVLAALPGKVVLELLKYPAKKTSVVPAS
jgi:hypothetical protein